MRKALGALLAVGLLAGCATSDPRDPHPVDALDYPVSVTADPNGRILWVTSGNFDLAWQGGAVLAVDAATHDFVRTAAGDPVAFQVGGFPGPFQLLVRDGRAVAGYVLSRVEDALYYVTLEGDPLAPEVSCPGGRRASSGILVCPAREALDEGTVVDEDEEERDVTLGADPYGAVVLPRTPGVDRDVLFTGALAGGTLAMFGLDDAGVPELLDARSLDTGLFAFARSPVTRRIYAAHRSRNVFDVLEVRPPLPTSDLERPRVVTVGQIVVPATLVADHARGLALSTDGTRLYAAYRSPSSLVVADIAAGDTGDPADRVLAKVPVGRRPGEVAVVPAHGDLPELVYVACQDDDRIDVVDPALGQVVDSILTGRKPFGLAWVDHEELGTQRLYVTNFQSQSVGVVELDPTSPWFHVQIAEIR